MHEAAVDAAVVRGLLGLRLMEDRLDDAAADALGDTLASRASRVGDTGADGRKVCLCVGGLVRGDGPAVALLGVVLAAGLAAVGDGWVGRAAS